MPSPYPSLQFNPWVMKSVLSVDGGGIRGYSSLVFLQALMRKVGELERAYQPAANSSIYSSTLGPLDDEVCAAPTPDARPRSEYWPCHYFDYIAGVGTGGIIAMLLGRYRMNVGEAMEKYRDICALVVERQLTSPQPMFVRREPVLSTNKKASIRSNVRTVEVIPAWPSPNEYDGDLESDPKRCRTLVCGCDIQLQHFRSYPCSEQRRHAVNDVVVRCLRAHPPLGTFPDAKYWYNNPSRTVLAEVSSLLDHKSSGHNGIDLLSIGAAITEPVNARANELQYLMSNQIQRVHREMTQARPFNLNNYCRLDLLDDNLDDIGVNEWKPETSNRSTFDRIEQATELYLQTETPAKQLHHFAAALVDKRRLRAETVQWERWALGLSYRCPEFTCHARNERFEDRMGFCAHLQQAHGMQRAVYHDVVRRWYEARGRTREAEAEAEAKTQFLRHRGISRGGSQARKGRGSRI